MTNRQTTLLEELQQIDDALAQGNATTKQEERGRQLVLLANAAPRLQDALLYFFNIMHDYECSLAKGYVEEAMCQSRKALEEAKGGRL